MKSFDFLITKHYTSNNNAPLNKQVFIINGSGGVGKDTFVNLIAKYIPITHITIAAIPKMIAEYFGWDTEKTEKERKLLSNIKLAIDEYNDGNYKRVVQAHKNFMNDEHTEWLIIDMREAKDIERAIKDFGAKTILIKRNSIPKITTNIADKGVFDIEYDYTIDNDGTIEDLNKKAYEFIKAVKSKIITPNYERIIYISHPFSGKKENKEEVEKITTKLAKKFPNMLFVSPISLFGFQYNDLTYEDGIKECLWLLSKCDTMLLTGDYKNSKGCRIEIDYCKKHNISIIGETEL